MMKDEILKVIRTCIFQYRLHVNDRPTMTMTLRVQNGKAYLILPGMTYPFVVIERWPIEISVALGALANTAYIEAVRIAEEYETDKRGPTITLKEDE